MSRSLILGTQRERMTTMTTRAAAALVMLITLEVVYGSSDAVFSRRPISQVGKRMRSINVMSIGVCASR